MPRERYGNRNIERADHPRLQPPLAQDPPQYPTLPLEQASADDLDVTKPCSSSPPTPRARASSPRSSGTSARTSRRSITASTCSRTSSTAPPSSRAGNRCCPCSPRCATTRRTRTRRTRPSYVEVIWRLRELEHYIRCVTDLGKAFGGLLGPSARPGSRGCARSWRRSAGTRPT